MTLTCADDVLAAVPVLLGFHPQHSVVMLTFGGQHAFHARVDMLDPVQRPDAVEEFVETLMAPVRREGAGAVVFVYYSPDARAVARVHRHLTTACRAEHVAVLEGLRVEAGRWFPAWEARSGEEGVPFDPAAHRFTAEAVGAGLVTEPSRDDLARRFEPDPEAVARIVMELDGAVAMPAWQARDLIEAHVGAVTLPSDAEAAALMVSLRDPRVREGVWWGIPRRRADRHVVLWTDLIRRAPEPALPEVAAVLAAVSWLSGHGALAWCALDRGRSGGTDNEVLALVERLLVEAVPPFDAWPGDRLSGGVPDTTRGPRRSGDRASHGARP